MDDEGEDADNALDKEPSLKNSLKRGALGLPPRSESFALKQKKQLREGVKHMTKYTMNERESMVPSRLMDKLMWED